MRSKTPPPPPEPPTYQPLSYEEAIGRRSNPEHQRPDVDDLFHSVTEGAGSTAAPWTLIGTVLLAGFVIGLLVSR